MPLPFHPLVSDWFTRQVGQPTDIQTRAWPRIAAGEHVLAVAPTGSGKTLTAFLAALDALATGRWPTGQTSVVYVSPLKALGSDVRANLVRPLTGLRQTFAAAGVAFPHIRAEIRSGDTPADARRRMLRQPPEILITTPESLNLLLSSKGGRGMLGAVRLVILDEIHAVAGSKRGVFLLAGVERLALLAGEFQRVALSATVSPLATVAAMVGGFRPAGEAADGALVPRPVAVVASPAEKRLELRVEYASWDERETPEASFLTLVAARVRRRIAANRTTLVFVNSRKLCEKLTRLVNADLDEPLAHAHHGSLAKELRQAVEARLKTGELRAVVATNSLELGIDIGSVDEVLLVECPPTVSAAVQRIGRSGHGVGEVSRAIFLPTSEKDLLEAAVMAKAAAGRDIEPLRPVEAPLDVLAQVLVAMLGVETWDVDGLYVAVRRCWSYRDLGRTAFDLTLGMLAGRYAATRLRELSPLVAIDALDGTASARAGALLRLYASGGVIADRGYYALRRQDLGTRLGELDEVFVWEARLGQVFAFGAHNWRIERITDADVFVAPAPAGAVPAPFWLGDPRSRDRHFSARIGDFLEEADARLGDPAYVRELETDYCLEPAAAQVLVGYLRRQQEATGAALPHARHLLIEVTDTGPGGAPGNQVILHAPLGLAVTAPLGLALETGLEALTGHPVPVFAGNDCVAVTLPGDIDPLAVLSAVPARDVGELVRARLEGSGAFGAAFREAAGRALLLPRDGFGKRQPLWITRLRARKLLAAVADYGDFPIVLEAWRTCLVDLFDPAGLAEFLGAAQSGGLAVTVAKTRVQSPFAADLVWRHITEYMYLTDAGTAAGPTGARPDLVAEVARGPDRPAVSEAVAAAFEQRRQRLYPGYAPGSAAELLEHVKERICLPQAEWRAILDAMARDHGLTADSLETALAAKLACIEPIPGGEGLVVALERAVAVAQAFWRDVALVRPMAATAKLPRRRTGAEDDERAAREGLLGQWLSFYGPRSLDSLVGLLGLSPAILQALLEDLQAAGEVVAGRLLTGREEVHWCDAANFETLLRLARAARRPVLTALPAGHVPYFLAIWQGLARPAVDPSGLAERVERLSCLPLPAGLWETEVLPARCPTYDPARLDAALEASGLQWFGAGKQKVLFARPDDLDLAGFTPRTAESGLFPDIRAGYDFSSLLEITGLSPKALTERLWQAVWKGEAACDGMAVLRRGVANGFTAEEAFTRSARGGRQAFRRTSPGRFAGSLPLAGVWRALRVPPLPDYPVALEALAMDRARLLLARYGVVCRDMLAREVPALGWSGVFRALRRMELSGEVVSGEFFAGLSGPQFADGRAVRLLTAGLSGDEPWWIAGRDPAAFWGAVDQTGSHALAGVGGHTVPADLVLPRRTAGTWVSFAGARPVAVFEAGGGRMTLGLSPDATGLPAALAPLVHVLTRRTAPESRLVVATINDVPAGESPYRDVLRLLFEVVGERRGLTLYRRRTDPGVPEPG
ncbi:DEAD/DEAH box helicase [Desulfovibrio sp. TomC]|uniref:DEAD/DEAH box helicase n=1 Tax=Desulfovibrio sp. TomC TaxID=1562888 RepID=UPI000575C718|nr:DEAD/DEAH box helicase [Desulfovibrio sp. TomC]KHK03997.1 Helicase domain protein [Desulfovibrio sp. TomC]